MAEQRVIAFNATDSGPAIGLTTAPVPVPDVDELLIRVSAFALNQADLLLTKGRHFVQSDLPIRLGYEASGEVVAVGQNAREFAIGERVSVIPNVDGPYWTAGEYALTHKHFTAHCPIGWSDIEAASYWMAYLTPYFPFAELFPFEPGEWVMITAASGGTGMGAIAMAKLLGAQVIATTRSPAKSEALRRQGADLVLSTEDDDFVDQVMAATGGVRLICDSLCGRYVEMLTRTLAMSGRLFIHGALGADDNLLSLPVLNLVHCQAGIYGYSLINELRHPSRLEWGRRFVTQYVADGRLPRPMIDSVFAFAETASAYDRMRSGEQTGKIVVSILS